MPTENRYRNTEIKPCPFCDGKAESRCTAGPDPDWFVQCTECRASADVFSEDNLTGWNNRAQLTEQHQGEPVAVLYANGSVLTKADCGDAFEICCKVETPLYTHADAGELELARKMLRSVQRREEKWALLCEGRNNQIATLRAQLAEQEHSARELLRVIGMSVQGSAAYNRAVIAFHDSLNADTKPN